MLGTIEEISFDNIKVWNFTKKAEEYIPDRILRDKINALLAMNKYGNHSIKDIGILSIGNVDFRPYSQAEIVLVNEVRLLLFLTFLAQNNVTAQGVNAGLDMATSENFSQVYQNFELANDHVSESAGYIVKSTIGGYKMQEISFVAPSHILKPWQVSFDDDLLMQLRQLKVLDGTFYDRILRATDLLFESYFNNPNVSLNARILLQVSALEVLLDLSMKDQRKGLKDKIKSTTVLPNDKVLRYKSERGSTTHLETESIKVMWADRFYVLRNHIIHGTTVPPLEFIFERQRHIDIAVMFFVVLVKKLLNQRLGSTIFFDEIAWSKFTDGDNNEHDGFVYDNGAFRKVVNAIKATGNI